MLPYSPQQLKLYLFSPILIKQNKKGAGVVKEQEVQREKGVKLSKNF